MFIEMTVFNGTDAEKSFLEICQFKGVRYNNYGFAIIETNHKNHDYVVPMDKENYAKLEGIIRNCILNDKQFIHFEGPVYRRKIAAGAFNSGKDKKDWKITVLK
ncbi:MAG: hypothetical protein K6B41_00375 [Butyrivibrio sp.]|nr:hypothetical protein [Butyrivibrio sp.]